MCSVMEPPKKQSSKNHRSQAGRKKKRGDEKGPNDIHNWGERIKQWADWSVQEPDPNMEFPPTSAMPGSAEKIEVLRERVANNWPLWHGMDAGGE